MEQTLFGLGEKDLRTLTHEDVDWLITPDEFLYVARLFGSFWEYNYQAMEDGRKGLPHAQLTSGLHSDGFFASKVLFAVGNMCQIMAHQMVKRVTSDGRYNRPDFVIGVPDSANSLAQDVSEILRVPLALMKKNADDSMALVTKLHIKARVLLVEDVCTRATGFTNAVRGVLRDWPCAQFVRINPVVLNRGPLANFYVDKWDFNVLSVASRIMKDWIPRECPLCADGSEAIRPKSSPENWQRLITSQVV